MLLGSLGGMALGFLVDSSSIGPQALASLCREGPVSLAASAAHHWDLLRATMVGMIAGGLVTAVVGARPTRLGCALLCHAAMLAGMILGGWLGPSLAASLGIAWGAAAMFAAMAVGMGSGFGAVAVFNAAARQTPLMSLSSRTSERRALHA